MTGIIVGAVIVLALYGLARWIEARTLRQVKGYVRYGTITRLTHQQGVDQLLTELGVHLENEAIIQSMRARHNEAALDALARYNEAALDALMASIGGRFTSRSEEPND